MQFSFLGLTGHDTLVIIITLCLQTVFGVSIHLKTDENENCAFNWGKTCKYQDSYVFILNKKYS